MATATAIAVVFSGPVLAVPAAAKPGSAGSQAAVLMTVRAIPRASVPAAVRITEPASVPATAPATAPSTVRSRRPDPSKWSNQQLAAELVLAGISMRSLSKAKSWARSGIGGIALFGTPPRTLAKRLRAVQSAAPGRRRILVASDEEGGLVQRLGSLLGALPSARAVGSTMNLRQATALATSYGAKMKKLGVNVNLAPVADLSVPGTYIQRNGRAFSSRPAVVGQFASAWITGMRASRVMSVVKHWPGHGSARNTHIGSGQTPPWNTVLRNDIVPFKAAFSAAVPAVMVGHLIVPGLTAPGLPASMSRNAMRYLRKAAVRDTLIMTDSLAMDAVTKAMHQSSARAAVRALVAGADIALVNTSDPLAIAGAITLAINSGKLHRAQAIRSARRVLSAQTSWR